MRIFTIAACALAVSVTVVACGGQDDTSSNTASTPTATVATAASTSKVNANSASRAELQRAFEAAGVTNAAQWAREVEEYRPYSASDTSWSKLRKELAKYNIAADVLEKIISTLQL